MATSFHLPVTAAQVGTYFVGQYYQLLQHQPDYVHQFYSDVSTMLRIDGNTREAATAMLQIHTLIMSLNYTGIEIKTAHSLESWNGGVIVMVSGAVHMKDFSSRRKFVQTFFLAPQEKGYFVLNDIFHYIDEEIIHHNPVTYLVHSNLNGKLNASAPIQEPVPNYMLGGDSDVKEIGVHVEVKENGSTDHHSFSKQQQQHASEAESICADRVVQCNGFIQSAVNSVSNGLAIAAEELAGEPQKHTYASILQVAKGPSAMLLPTQPPPPVSEWNHATEPPCQLSVASSIAIESGGTEAEGSTIVEDEGEIKSVYVRNLPSHVSANEIEDEFKKFGKLKPNAVAIRSRKDNGVCYAFVEFEDITGVQNAIKASIVQIAGCQVFIEGRRASRGNASRGGRRGRGKSGYAVDVPRGRLSSRSFGRGNGQDGNHRDYQTKRKWFLPASIPAR
ncbi:hypothetical protein NMG60_11017549 [Bertholletia excelsa]